MSNNQQRHEGIHFTSVHGRGYRAGGMKNQMRRPDPDCGRAARVLAATRCASLIAGILVGSSLYRPVFALDVTVRPERVISVVTADWNSDGAFDRALLLESETEPDHADLLVYLSESRGVMRRAVSKKDIAWRGALWGTQPALELTEHGSLIIISANEAIGRHRWIRKLTAVYRDTSFVVAGYAYSERDALDPDVYSSCEINLLTGKGVKNNKPFRIAAGAVALADWSEASLPQQCR